VVCIEPGSIPVEQEAENRIIRNIFLSFMVTTVSNIQNFVKVLGLP
tara:strand:- start:1405 stop:1542 length:138 start_codon:yes stop_codon:yes gene_type:complete